MTETTWEKPFPTLNTATYFHYHDFRTWQATAETTNLN